MTKVSRSRYNTNIDLDDVTDEDRKDDLDLELDEIYPEFKEELGTISFVTHNESIILISLRIVEFYTALSVLRAL